MSRNNSRKKTVRPKKKNSVNMLFNSDRFLLIFSLVISFFIWTAVSTSSGEIANYPISDIPVTMELSDEVENDDLAVVSINGVPLDKFTTTVRVKGNSVTVGSLTSSDIQVYGSNLGTIAASGTYNVTLMARQLGVKANYDIASIEPNEVTVVVDKYISKELTIDTSQIIASTPAEYYMGTPSLSSKTVTVRGPGQSVSKVEKAVVSLEFEGDLKETTVEKNVKVMLLDEDGNEVEDDSLVVDPIEVDVSITVLRKKTVPLQINYENMPGSFDPSGFITIEPAEIEIAAASNVLDSVESINVGTLDFSEISYGMSPISYDIVMPEGVKNVNSIAKTEISFDFTNYRTKSFVISDFDYTNIPYGLAAEYSSYRNVLVRVVGPTAEISNLKASEVTATIDLTDAKLGTVNMPVAVSINKMTSCWILGSYNVNVTIVDAASAVSSQPTASSRIEDTDSDLSDE